MSAMYPRTHYEMTEDQLKVILDACKSVPVMMIGGYSPSSPQENANRAWAALGKEMGFDSMTVEPVEGRGNRFFTAVPNESETAKTERLAREAEEKKQARIVSLEQEISHRQQELADLRR